MRIKSLTIKKLFDIFDYDISFESKESVLIITGPNGHGKTMVLNIIFNLFNRKFLFFQKLSFKEIILSLDNGVAITIEKSIENEKPRISFYFEENGGLIESFDYSDKLETDFERTIQRYLPVRRISTESWVDMRTDRKLSIEEVLSEYADQLPEEVRKNVLRIKSPKVNEILDSIQVHLIREQRLFKKIKSSDRNYTSEKDHSIMEETIQTYAKELRLHISQYLQQSFIKTQLLDSTYPDRLINEVNKFTEEEYTSRYNTLKIKRQKLTQFGLYQGRQEFLAYNQDDAKALTVYIKDLEVKLSVFDDLLTKLELFTNILNERRFTFKSINVNNEKGFYFRTVKGKELELNQLSSGEQHEVVLLYELIFNTRPNVLVLIDEPEISLHISWQKEFLNDLIRIIEIQNIQVLIASHSPSIINDRWDLVYNLTRTGNDTE